MLSLSVHIDNREIGLAAKVVIGPGVVQWVERVNNRKDGYGFAVGIGVERDGEIAGGVVFHDFNGANIFIHVASNGSRKWLTREFLHVIFSYAFDQCKVARITGVVPESNTAAFGFDTAVGFIEEARMVGAHPKGDMVILKMTRDSCRWIDYERFPQPASGP